MTLRVVIGGHEFACSRCHFMKTYPNARTATDAYRDHACDAWRTEEEDPDQ